MPKPVVATILRVPFFATDCRGKASDGYNTTGAIFCHRLQGIKPVIATIQLLPFFSHRLQGIKPVMARILLVPFFPQIAGNKATDGYNTTAPKTMYRLQGIKPVIATMLLLPVIATKPVIAKAVTVSCLKKFLASWVEQANSLKSFFLG